MCAMKISAKEKMPKIDKKLMEKGWILNTHIHIRVLKFLNKFSLVNCKSGSIAKDSNE